MSDASIPRPCPGERLDTLKLMALHLLTDDPPIWSVEDLGRELNDPAGVQDAVRGLREAGLLYQTSDGYVFASRAACRMVELTGRAG
jgi:hypothetical protein